MKRLFFHIVSITLLMDAVFGGSYVQPQQYQQVQVVHHYIYAPPPPPPPPYGVDGFDSYGTLNNMIEGAGFGALLGMMIDQPRPPFFPPFRKR